MDEQHRDILTLAKGTGVSLAGSVLGRFCLFLTYVIIARSLGPEPLGVFALAVVAVKVAALMARLGLDTAAIRFVSVFHKDAPGSVKGTLISSIAISFFAGIALGVTLYFTAMFLSKRVFHHQQLEGIIKILSISVPFVSSMLVIARSTQGFQTTKYFVYIHDVAQPVTNLILLTVFISLNAGIRGAAYAFILSHVVGMCWGMYVLASKGLLGRTARIKAEYRIAELVSYSAPLWMTSLLVFLMAWTDTIMLGAMKSSYEVGIYRAAAQIPLMLAMILGASNSIYAPMCAGLYAQGKIDSLGSLLKTSTRWVVSLTLPLALGIIFSAGPLMYIFGAKFVSLGASVLIVLTLGQLINTMTGGIGLTLAMTGKRSLQMINSIAMIGFNVILNLLLIPTFGSVGAAFATALSLAAINILRLVEVYLLYRVHPYDINYLQLIAGGSIAAATVIIFKTAVEIHSGMLVVLANFCIAGVIFWFFFLTLGPSEEDKYLFETLASRISSFRASR